MKQEHEIVSVMSENNIGWCEDCQCWHDLDDVMNDTVPMDEFNRYSDTYAQANSNDGEDSDVEEQEEDESDVQTDEDEIVIEDEDLSDIVSEII